MGYEVALTKAWEPLSGADAPAEIAVRLLADEYRLTPADKRIVLLSTMQPAADFVSILLLHYLAATKPGTPPIDGEWLTFRELSDVEGYLPAFRKRAIEPLIKKFASSQDKLLAALNKVPGKKADGGIVVGALEGVPALIKVWPADDEFGADANIYFDRSIKAVFCTEDIVVLAGLIAHNL